MFLAKSGVCKFPENLGDYEKVLADHKEAQKTQRKQLMVGFSYTRNTGLSVDLMTRLNGLYHLQARLEEIQLEARSVFLSRRPWRSVDTALASFPSTELARSLGCGGAGGGELVAEYQVPRGQACGVPLLTLGRAQLDALRSAGANLHMAAA